LTPIVPSAVWTEMDSKVVGPAACDVSKPGRVQPPITTRTRA